MSSANANPSLPVISIASYVNRTKSTNAERKATASALHAACRDYGFFYLDISSFAQPEEMEELLRLAREFFALTQTEKDKISIRNQDQARGYQRLKENVTGELQSSHVPITLGADLGTYGCELAAGGKADNHEAIDLYAPVENPDKTKSLWGENQWPDAVPEFQRTFEDWIARMKELGLIVMEAMSDGLGLTSSEWNDLRGCIDNSFWVMRIIGYPPLPNDHDGFSCGAHKDYGCLTFLYADPTPDALQVFVPGSLKRSLQTQPAVHVTKGLPEEGGASEGEWIYANPIPGCIVCNVGEMWEIWTKGLYKSTLHRVIHRGSNYRVSLPFFFEPNFDALIKPLAAVQREVEQTEMADSYSAIVYGDFLKKKVGSNFAAAGEEGKGRY